MIGEIKYKLTKWFQKKVKVDLLQVPLETIGTHYGGWTIPANFVHSNAVCYLAGAGEDISFDVGLAQKYQCEVHIFDPTPRAEAHWKKLHENTLLGKPALVNNRKDDVYDLSKENLKHLHFHLEGLWSENTTIKFYAPANPRHVSHSALNLQQTDDYFEAKVSRLQSVMQRLGHQRIDLLKIDIEGAEYEVLKTVVEDQLEIGVICIEFDESARHHVDSQYVSRIQGALDSLVAMGYKVVFADMAEFNFTLWKR